MPFWLDNVQDSWFNSTNICIKFGDCFIKFSQNHSLGKNIIKGHFTFESHWLPIYIYIYKLISNLIFDFFFENYVLVLLKLQIKYKKSI